MSRSRQRLRLLAAFQVLAGLAVLPYGGEVAVTLTAIAWLVLALVSIVCAQRPFTWALEVLLYASLVVLTAHAVLTPRPQMQVLDGLELMMLMLFAAFSLPAVRVRIMLGVAGGMYLVAMIVNPLGQGAWIGLVIVAMVGATTIVVLRLLEQVRRAGERDPLTGALNRAGLREHGEVVRALAARSGQPTTVVFVDIDHFKQFNDKYGHIAGDRILVDMAHALRAHLRQTDLVARIGGDEFVLILPGTSPTRAGAALERLHRFAPISFTHGASSWREGQELLSAIDEADRLMYERKQRHGKIGERRHA